MDIFDDVDLYGVEHFLLLIEGGHVSGRRVECYLILATTLPSTFCVCVGF